MQYHSTRGLAPCVDSADAVLLGLASDGGLYLPQAIPAFDWQKCVMKDTFGIATQILSAFLPDIPEMEDLVRRAYAGKFQTEDLTPTTAVGDFTVLELFHGPTAAFKDVALCMLPQLMTAAKQVKGMQKDILILTATSGDTGKAALEGFRDVPGVGICVFYPHGGVSKVQRAQMVTQKGNNVQVCGVEGNFDDAQTGVKRIFAACQKENLLTDKNFQLSSANSINIGRLAPQITYYFKAYRDLLDRGQITMGQPVNYCVPTGNFGDILAGYLAKLLGLPVGRLICASNSNKVLTDFIRTGIYDRNRPLHKTISPSMDILVSSNLERMLYLLSEGGADLVAALMKDLEAKGSYAVPQELLRKLQEVFWADYCTDEQSMQTIGKVWNEYGYLCDPHTATGWAVAESYTAQTRDDRPMVVLATASAYKFPGAVLQAMGETCHEDEFTQMDTLMSITGQPIPANLAALRDLPERHTGVIAKEQMLQFVLER